MEKPTGFNLKYLFVGEGAKDWWKALGNGWRLIVIGFIAILLIVGGLNLWNILFPKSGDNIARPRIIALPGSHIGSISQNIEQKQETKKRPWFMPIPYVSIYGGARTQTQSGSINLNDYDPEIGVQAGLRWDFN